MLTERCLGSRPRLGTDNCAICRNLHNLSRSWAGLGRGFISHGSHQPEESPPSLLALCLPKLGVLTRPSVTMRMVIRYYPTGIRQSPPYVPSHKHQRTCKEHMNVERWEPWQLARNGAWMSNLAISCFEDFCFRAFFGWTDT